MSFLLVAGRWSGSPVIDFRYRIAMDCISCGLYAAETMAQIGKNWCGTFLVVNIAFGS